MKNTGPFRLRRSTASATTRSGVSSRDAMFLGGVFLSSILVTACGEETSAGAAPMLRGTPSNTPTGAATDPAETSSNPIAPIEAPTLPAPGEPQGTPLSPASAATMPEPVNMPTPAEGGATNGGSGGSRELGGNGGMPSAAGGSGGDQGGSGGLGEGGGTSPGGSSTGGAPVTIPLPEDDRCDVAVYDPASPPQAFTLSGNLGVHDPVIMEQDGTFYLFATGTELGAKTSEDLRAWDGAQEVFDLVNRPSWISQRVPGVSNLWAPDISYFGGQYHLYYSASTFGSNTSCIGHLTRESLSSGEWTAENEPTICTNGSENYNAIDPNVVVDVAGTPWLSFGSFWDGIRIIALNQNGQRADDEIHAIASRGGEAIEAPFIVRRCGYYYLFVSFDRCCQGADSTYNIRVGRSTEVLGPYEDRSGEPMLEGGGTLLVEGNDEWHGPGHNAVIFTGDRAYDIHHAYAASNGASQLRISELAWDDDGWPISGGP